MAKGYYRGENGYLFDAPVAVGKGYIRASVNFGPATRGEDGKWVCKNPQYVTLLASASKFPNFAKAVAKSRVLAVEGKLEVSEYTSKTGEKKTSLTCFVSHIELADPDQRDRRFDENHFPFSQERQVISPASGQAYANKPSKIQVQPEGMNVSDDDVPF